MIMPTYKYNTSTTMIIYKQICLRYAPSGVLKLTSIFGTCVIKYDVVRIRCLDAARSAVGGLGSFWKAALSGLSPGEARRGLKRRENCMPLLRRQICRQVRRAES